MKLHASFTQKNGMLISCTVKGHADYTEEDPSGQILCAAVSSAVQLTCNTLTECFGAAVTITEQPSESAENTRFPARCAGSCAIGTPARAADSFAGTLRGF